MKRGMLAIGVLGLVVLFFSAAIATAQTGPIKVGVNSAWEYPGGQGVKRGGEMAIKAINDAGGLLGRKVEGFSMITRWTPTRPRARRRGSCTRTRWT